MPDLKDGSKIFTSEKGKATIFNSFIKNIFAKKNNTILDFKPVCDANNSEVVFF